MYSEISASNRIAAKIRNHLPLLLTAIASACASAAAMAARIVGDSLFLERYRSSTLSFMYLLTAVVVGVFAVAFGQAARRTALNLLLIRFCGVLVLVGIILRVLIYVSAPGSRILVYVWADATVSGTAILFWSLFGQVFDIHEGKQALGVVGAAATLGCILTGFFVRPFARVFGTANLLLIVALLVSVMAVMVLALMWSGTQLRGVPAARSNHQAPGTRYYLQLFRGARVRVLAMHVGVAAFVIILVEFQFKAAAQSKFSGAALAGFFGTFYGAANAVGLLLQLLIMRELLRGKRLSTSLQVLPGTFALGGVAILLVGPWAVIATRFLGQILQYGVDGAGMQLVFLGIRKHTRPQVRALAEGIFRPIAIALAAGVLAVVSHWLSSSILAVLTTVTSIAWLMLARKDYQLYVSDLLSTLNARLLDFSGEHKDLQDSALEDHLRRHLASCSTSEELSFVVSVILQMHGVDWSAEMLRLLDNEDVEIKIQALRYFADRPEHADYERMMPLLIDPDPTVRRSAVSALSRSARNLAEITPLISDADPHVRATAAVATARHGSQATQGAAIQAIYRMATDEEVQNRIAVAQAAAGLTGEQRFKLLKRMLSDPSTQVRCAALGSCGTDVNGELLPPILEAVFNRDTSDRAVAALIGCGEELTAYLERFGDGELAFLFRRSDRLTGVLTKIGNDRSLRILRRAVLSSDKNASSLLIRAFCALARRQISVDTAGLHEALQVQLSAARAWRVESSRIAETPATELLKRAMVDEFVRHLDNAFRIVTTLYPDSGLEGIRTHIRSKNAELRSEAMELLEHVIPSALSRQFSSLMNVPGRLDRELGTDILALAEAANPESVLLGVLEAFTQSGIALPASVCALLLKHSSGLVRQATLYCLTKTSPDRVLVRDECVRLSLDDDPRVAQFASSLIREGGISTSTKEGIMTVIEKIMTLARVPIFSELDTTALAHVSSFATEETFPEGTQIIVEGEYGQHMFIILDGSVEITTNDMHIATLSRGEFVGEMSMLDGGARSASVRASTDCLLLRIDKDDFEQLLSTYSSAALAVIRALSKRLRDGVAVAASA